MAEPSGVEELAALKLIERALGFTSSERRNFILTANVAPAVRDRALALLARRKNGARQVRTGGAGDMLDDVAPVPNRIGAYAIRDEIGRGGMGAVYLAERDTGDFDHRVAIKMILTGNLSPRLVERFAFERQALASLNHPHIAQLFDGGETKEGLPYVVMELVEGRNLRAWLEQEKPSLDARFVVLEQLLDALEYAHSRLVIHRDLTPENVIVDENGNAKLIDFGISSFQSLRADDLEAAKEFRTGLSGTPGFAAPESDRDVAPTVAIDIFAIGKLVEVMFEGGVTPELQAIANKAAAEDPKDRYDSIGDLADAISRYRNGHPLDEFSTGAGYRIGKFVQRNAIGTSVAAMFLLTILGSVVVLSISLANERQARDLAEERFLAVRDLSAFQLFDVYDALVGTPGSTQVLADLAQRSQTYLEQLRLAAADDDELRYQAAIGWLRLAKIQGDPLGGSLGLRAEALESLTIAESELSALVERNPGSAAYRIALAESLLAQSDHANFVADEVELAAAKAEKAYEVLEDGPTNAQANRLRVQALMKQAAPLPWIGEAGRSTRMLGDAADLFDELFPDPLADQDTALLKAKLLGQTGQSNAFEFEESGDTATAERALALLQEAIDIHRGSERLGVRAKVARRNIAIATYERAMILADLRREPEGLAELKGAEKLIRRSIDEDSADQEALRQLATLLSQQVIMQANTGQATAALPAAREMIELFERLLAMEPSDRGRKIQLATTLMLSAEAFEKADRGSTACSMNRRSAKFRDELNREQKLDEYLRETIFGDLRERLKRTCSA